MGCALEEQAFGEDGVDANLDEAQAAQELSETLTLIKHLLKLHQNVSALMWRV